MGKSKHCSQPIGKCYFTLKLRELLSNPCYSNYIHWTESGDSFIVNDTVSFAEDILPIYFKTNNYKSFMVLN